MIIMANTICHDEYCEPRVTIKNDIKSTLSDNAVTVSYVLFTLLLAAIALDGFM